MSSKELSRADQLIKSGNKAAAFPILKEFVLTNPNNEHAWLCLYSCAENIEQKKFYLQQVLKINPENHNAQNALSKLEIQTTTNSQITNHDVGNAPHPSLQKRINDYEKHFVKNSRIKVQTLIIILITIALFSVTAIIFYLSVF